MQYIRQNNPYTFQIVTSFHTTFIVTYEHWAFIQKKKTNETEKNNLKLAKEEKTEKNWKLCLNGHSPFPILCQNVKMMYLLP